MFNPLQGSFNNYKDHEDIFLHVSIAISINILTFALLLKKYSGK